MAYARRATISQLEIMKTPGLASPDVVPLHKTKSKLIKGARRVSSALQQVQKKESRQFVS